MKQNPESMIYRLRSTMFVASLFAIVTVSTFLTLTRAEASSVPESVAIPDSLIFSEAKLASQEPGRKMIGSGFGGFKSSRMSTRTMATELPEAFTTQAMASMLPAPCPANGSQFGTVTLNTTGVVQTITTCVFAGEYSTINGTTTGQTLTITSTGGSSGNEITVRGTTPSGAVIASGTGSVTFMNTVTGTIYVHINTTACGTDGSCHTTTVQCNSCSVPTPANDLCTAAIPITAPSVTNATTVGSTVDTVPTCTTTFGTSGGVWYEYTGDGGTATMSLCGSSYDTKIGVFTGSCGTLSCVAGNDDFCGLQSQVSFPTTAGTVYRILVTGFSTNTGNFTLTASTTGPPSTDLVVTGSGIDDVLIVTATGANTGSYTLNGGAAVPFSGITSFTFNGMAGSDTLTINNPAAGLFDPANGIDFNGGGQPGDNMNLLGGTAASETYFVGTTTPPIGAGPGNNGDGLIRYTGPALDIRFTGLAPIVDTVAAGFLTVNATDAANTISVTNGAVAPRLRVAVDAFEPIDFDNKTAVAVNSGDGTAGGDAVDTVSVNYSNVPAALTNLSVNGDEGNDILTVLARAGSHTLSLNGGDNNDQLNAAATVAGPGSILLNGNDGNDSLIGGGDDDVFDGGQGDDTFLGNGGTDNVGGGAGVSVDDRVLVPGTAAGDTIALSVDGSGFLLATVNAVTTTYRNFIGGAFNTAGIESLRVTGDAGNDAITVSIASPNYDIHLSGGDNDDQINASATVSGPNAIVLNGNDGNDTLIGGGDDDVFDGGQGDDTFLGNGGTDNVGGGAGVSVDDRVLVPGTAAGDTITLSVDGSGFLLATVNAVTTTYRNFLSGPFSSAGIEAVNLNADAGNDTINVAPLAGTAINVDGGSPVLPTVPGDGLNVDFTGTTGFLFTPGVPGAGVLTFTNRAAVSYVSIENQPFTSTTTVTSSPASPTVFGQSVTFTATVAGIPPGSGTPSGTVTFNIDGILNCVNTPLVAGVATCTKAGLPTLPAGVRNVVAIYSGDLSFSGSTGTLNHTVNKASTTIAITGDTPDPTIIGQPYAVTWAVAVTAPGAGTPTGTVTVSDGSATCSAPVGAGTCNLTSTTAGNKLLFATYAGDANFLGSVSTPGVPHV
ncbi:MAG: Ig-like domain-containing protein, partial [Pyrinomonadaceae bacterium]